MQMVSQAAIKIQQGEQWSRGFRHEVDSQPVDMSATEVRAAILDDLLAPVLSLTEGNGGLVWTDRPGGQWELVISSAVSSELGAFSGVVQIWFEDGAVKMPRIQIPLTIRANPYGASL